MDRPAARTDRTRTVSANVSSPRTITAALTLVMALALALLTLASLPSVATSAVTLPSGFRGQLVFDGLSYPTAVRFSPDGRVFVAEKSGVIKVFDNLDDTTPTTFADLSTNVHDFWDRGLLGLALDPNFPSTPYVYALYTYDAKIGGAAPRWSDSCPSPPGPTDDGCVVSGRLSRLQASGNQMTGSETVLIEDWCQQYPSHSVGDLAFGSDGKLYVSGGDGASFTFADYGQGGGTLPDTTDPKTKKNPCGDPPAGVGGAQTPPAAEGGALRSQDLRTTGDPAGLNGAILRVNPDNGKAARGNPFYNNSSDKNVRRVVAYGMRNPFRFTVRPGTGDIWLGDVGWGTYEEINRVRRPADSTAENFGWPCYEGAGRQASYDSSNLDICQNLSPDAVTAPVYSYSHGEPVVAGESCPTSGGSSITGMAFYEGGSYPDEYDGALFFTDYARQCIWAIHEGANGLPDPGTRETFMTGAESPVALQAGPGGDLYYVDFLGGKIRRISYDASGGGNDCPTGQYRAEYYNNQMLDGVPAVERCEEDIDNAWGLGRPVRGVGTDNFSARWTGTHEFEAGDYTFTATSDDGIRLWVDDELIIDEWRNQASPTFEATRAMSAGEHEVRVEYYEYDGPAEARVDWRQVGGPTSTIDSPSSTLKWKVGDDIDFSGSATGSEGETLPAEDLFWTLIMHHCPSTPETCHQHTIQSFQDVDSGSFTAPDHEYPSYLELRLTATGPGGTDTDSVRLDPQTVELTYRSKPSRLKLTVGETTARTPFTRTVIAGSKNSVSAKTPQKLHGETYEFGSWSDGGAQSHLITAPDTATTYKATYEKTTKRQRR